MQRNMTLIIFSVIPAQAGTQSNQRIL